MLYQTFYHAKGVLPAKLAVSCYEGVLPAKPFFTKASLLCTEHFREDIPQYRIHYRRKACRFVLSFP